MSKDEFNMLSSAEQQNFIECSDCGEMVDCRHLDEVFFHDGGHVPRPDIQYSGSKCIKQASQK